MRVAVADSSSKSISQCRHPLHYSTAAGSRGDRGIDPHGTYRTSFIRSPLLLPLPPFPLLS